MDNKKKITMYCGITDSDDKPVKLTKEEQEAFIKGMGGNTEDQTVIYCETPPFSLIPLPDLS